MKNIINCIIFSFFVSSIFSQSDVSGFLKSELNEPLIGATVVLLDNVDSTLVEFTITNDEGLFQIPSIDEGEYILQLSYVSYASQSSSITISSGKNELGEFILSPSSEVLQEVTLKASHIPMGILGDTINYNAAAFKTKAGASVEDLLKKLPGVEVARDGSIKAQGEDVEKVLVDGKEFFGNDPKIATQNLEAKAVDKVQVFDKKSEMAEFTGIDDGQEEKTINLQLKEGYKTGGFGNVKLAGGTESTYDGKINYNRFNSSTQASILFSSNNINKQAFSFNEFIGFMGGLSNAMAANSGIFNFGEFHGGDTPPGIRDDISGGANLNIDFSKSLKLSSNYFYLSTKQTLLETNNAVQFLNNEEYSSVHDLDEVNKTTNHRLNARLTYKPNPFIELVWKNTVLGLQNNIDSESETAFSINQSTSTETASNYMLDGTQLGYNGSIQLKKKFGKKGRNWINSINYSSANMNDNNDILNEYVLGMDLSSIVQNQAYTNMQQEYSIRSSYSEPLGKKMYLGLSYVHNRNQENPEKLFYDLEGTNSILNKSLSTLFEKTFHYNRTGINFKKNSKRSKLNLGLSNQWTSLIGQSLSSEEGFDNQYSHVLPNLNWKYDFNSSTSIDVGYDSNVSLPSLSQLLPVIDNSNADYSIIGNSNLIPEYAHSMHFNLNHFDHFNFTNLFMNFRFNIIEDRIVNSVTVDENLIKILNPINSKDFKSASAYLSFSKSIRPLKIKYRIGSQSSFNSYESILNNQANGVSEFSSTASLTIENRIKERFDIAFGIRVNYSSRTYDQNESFNQRFNNYALFFDADWFITESLTLSTSYDFKKYSNEFFAEQQTFNLLNASVKKSFKENLFSIELTAFDILGQNIGVNRTGGINSLNELQFNTLQKHYRIGLSYRLGKKKKKDGIQFDEN